MTKKGYYLLEKITKNKTEAFKFVKGSAEAPLDRIIEDVLQHQNESRELIVAKEIVFEQKYTFKTEKTKELKKSNVNCELPKLEEGTYFILFESENYSGCNMSDPYPDVIRTIEKYSSTMELFKKLVTLYAFNIGMPNKNKNIHVLKPIKVDINYSLEEK